jgi:hypothetical protein
MRLPPDFFRFQLKDVVPTFISIAALAASLASLRANFGKPAKIRAVLGNYLTIRLSKENNLAISADVILINEGAFPAFANVASLSLTIDQKFGLDEVFYFLNIGDRDTDQVQPLNFFTTTYYEAKGASAINIIPRYDTKSIRATFVSKSFRGMPIDYKVELHFFNGRKMGKSSEVKIRFSDTDFQHFQRQHDQRVGVGSTNEPTEELPDLRFVRTDQGFISIISIKGFDKNRERRNPLLRSIARLFRFRQ